MKRKTVLMFTVLMIVSLFGCATLVRDGYRTLAISQQTYDGTMSALGDLYKEGLLSDSQKDAAVVLGRAYMMAHNAAVVALMEYESNPSEYTKDKYLAAAKAAAAELAKLVEYAKNFLKKEV